MYWTVPLHVTDYGAAAGRRGWRDGGEGSSLFCYLLALDHHLGLAAGHDEKLVAALGAFCDNAVPRGVVFFVPVGARRHGAASVPETRRHAGTCTREHPR